jgi:hypothetical protein
LSETSSSPGEAAAVARSSSKVKTSRLAPVANPKPAIDTVRDALGTKGNPTSKAQPAAEDDGDVSPLDLSPTVGTALLLLDLHFPLDGLITAAHSSWL